jgi:hypothetical protein
MIKLLSSATEDNELCPFFIPSIQKGLDNVKCSSQISPNIYEASLRSEKIILDSNYVDASVYYKVNALKESAKNLERNLELAISELKEKIASLAKGSKYPCYLIDCR